MELIVPDQEALVIGPVLRRDPLDELFGSHALGLRLDHDRGAVRVLGTHVDAVVTLHTLEADPDVRLYGLDDVAQVQWAVGVGKGARDENLAGHPLIIA